MLFRSKWEQEEGIPVTEQASMQEEAVARVTASIYIWKREMEMDKKSCCRMRIY